ncbi:MAG: hypothetical protein RLN87_06275 [Parasphingopyxis sp.]
MGRQQFAEVKFIFGMIRVAFDSTPCRNDRFVDPANPAKRIGMVVMIFCRSWIQCDCPGEGKYGLIEHSGLDQKSAEIMVMPCNVRVRIDCLARQREGLVVPTGLGCLSTLLNKFYRQLTGKLRCSRPFAAFFPGGQPIETEPVEVGFCEFGRTIVQSQIEILKRRCEIVRFERNV